MKNVFVLTCAGMENVGTLKCMLIFHCVQTGYASVLCKFTFFQQLRLFDWYSLLPSIDLQLTEVTTRKVSKLRHEKKTRIQVLARLQYTCNLQVDLIPKDSKM